MYREPAIFPRILLARYRLGKIEIVGTFDGPKAREKANELKVRVEPGKVGDRYEILTATEYTLRTGLVW